ncbi:LysR family transcriptional regulator [Pseudogemmobacter humi]|uniref:HTH-type transcriptional regulator GltC n=1 Tax=Pseudogemmobacter humi TaxID=2483812 RepID=A0A3P5XBK2_9RHOB|nr:LysR substrate-binding domain-containing protein [Pseudogemmobacter humi]VDC28673.1 HTH-type transcriptional regulator GltC [Pseudogemmobacter humi]
MDITQLRTLIHVAELGSLSKAADRLHIAQPALSRHVRMLEEELDTRLFDRHGRGMVLTEQGQGVLQHALRIMAELDEIRTLIKAEGAPLRGHVSVGLPPTVSDIFAAPLVAAFRERHPEATIRIVSAYSSYLQDWLHRGEIDLAILLDPNSVKSLKSKLLIEESLYIVAPPGTGFTIDAPFEFRNLSKAPLCLPSHRHSLRSMVSRAARDCGIEIPIQVEADSYSVLKSLVLLGHGWTILPLAAIHKDIAEGKLCAAPLVNPPMHRQLMICYPFDRPTARLAEFAGRTMFDTTAGLVAAGAWSGRMLDGLDEAD